MDIGFTEEQELLLDTARKFLDSECPTSATWHRERGAPLMGALVVPA
jgi:hypothetical protein